jgi:ribosomal protein L11 methyltransferase
MHRSFTQIIFIIKENEVELLAHLLQENGALAVALQDAADQALFQLQPEETPLWEKTKVSALFPADTNLDVLLLSVKQQFPHIELQIENIENQDWVATTQNYFQPQHYAERLWILPSWYDEKSFSGAIVKLDPGLAFGTGTHPTTAMCLEWLAQHPPKNLTVIDYGCGSGILALACLALGAKKVIAVDHDPQALTATKNNSVLNNFVNDTNLQICLPQHLPAITADLVVANILANPIMQLASHLMQLTSSHGKLVLSGFFSIDVERITAAFAPTMQIESVASKEQWARVVLKTAHQINS